MRLKTLRKERPTFETEGAVINGNRMDLSKNDFKSTKHRSNTSFALPSSLNIESSSGIIFSPNQTHEMSTRCHQQVVIPPVTQTLNVPFYQALETACLEQGIRIRLSPTRTIQQSGRRSVNSFPRHTTFTNRNPSRASSVLHYTMTNLDQHYDYRPFSALQQTSSNDFEQHQVHNVSYAQSLQINEETHDDCHSSSIIASEHVPPMTPPEKSPLTNEITYTTSKSFENDPDLAYMSSLLKTPSGESFRDTIRRRAGLRGTFAVHRNALTANSFHLQEQSREKSFVMNKNSLSRSATMTVVQASPAKKIDKDILKHASRIRRTSQSKDYLIHTLQNDTTPIVSSPLKTTTINNNNHNQRNSINKPLKSFSLEPLELLLASTPHSELLSAHDSSSFKTLSTTRNRKTPAKRTKSAKTSTTEKQNTTNRLMGEHSNSSSLSHDDSLSLMKTSPLDIARQSNSFDSGCYDRSSSGGDAQSLTSSSIIQIQRSISSARLTNSAARRSNTNKKVSFYEEPSAVILTTATYV